MATATTYNSKPLPLWAKGLITMVALGMVGCLATIIIGTAAFKQLLESAQDQAYIKSVAQKMVKLPDPLPKKYSYMLGVDFFGMMQVVSIDYANEKQRLVFVSCPTDMTSKEMLTTTYERGIITSNTQAQFTDVLSEGSWLIQDTQIPYRVGKLEGNEGLGLVACRSTIDDQIEAEQAGLAPPQRGPRTGRALILYAVQPRGEKFDMNVCTDLLQPY